MGRMMRWVALAGAAGAVRWVEPVAAGVAGPNGTLIENTVFEHQVVEEVTHPGRDRLHSARIIALGTVDDRVNDVVHRFDHSTDVADAADASAAPPRRTSPDPGWRWRWRQSAAPLRLRPGAG